MNLYFPRFFKPTASLIILLFTLSLSASCAFEPGQPWGYIEAGISLDDDHLEIPPDITIESIQLSINAMHLYSTAASSTAAQFDPANPPPGYAQCHGGHCHADDGTLPTYAEIQAKMFGGTANKKHVASAQFSDKLTLKNELENELKIIESGNLTSVDLEVSRLHIHATAKHDNTNAPLTIDIPLQTTKLSHPIALSVDRDSPHHQELELGIELPHDLLASIVPDQLTAKPDGSFTIDPNNNADLLTIIADVFKHEAEIFVIDDHDHDHDHD